LTRRYYGVLFIHFVLCLRNISQLEILRYHKKISKDFYLKKEIMQLLYLIFHDQIVLDIHGMTICIENHFSLNKIFFLTVGLWPYHRTKLVEFHFFLFVAILTSFIIVQVCLYFIILYNRLINILIYFNNSTIF